MDANITKFMNTLKKETESYGHSESKTEAGVTKVAQLTKPVKAPTWTKKMSLATYIKQLTTWSEINEDVPEHVKYHDLIEE